MQHDIFLVRNHKEHLHHVMPANALCVHSYVWGM